MPETEKTIDLFGTPTKVVDVPILAGTDPVVEYELEDGSRLRVKHSVASILRVEGRFNPDGSPIYLIMVSPVTSVLKHSFAETGQ